MRRKFLEKRRNTMREIFIDFDGTITNFHGFDRDPAENAVETINKLYDAGFGIVIYSCRSNPEICSHEEHLKMVNYLTRNGIKFHRIEFDKPYYTLIIDDKAINPNIGWDNIGKFLLDNKGTSKNY
jgi:predicted mannosyl-3-phosphoglycerate phosphatase (HAD superfamily)